MKSAQCTSGLCNSFSLFYDTFWKPNIWTFSRCFMQIWETLLAVADNFFVTKHACFQVIKLQSQCCTQLRLHLVMNFMGTDVVRLRFVLEEFSCKLELCDKVYALGEKLIVEIPFYDWDWVERRKANDWVSLFMVSYYQHSGLCAALFNKNRSNWCRLR